MTYEQQITSFETGDVLMDADLLETALLATEDIGDRPWLKRTVGLSSLAQFIQGLVLYNHIYFDGHVCYHSELLPPAHELEDLVLPFTIDPTEEGVIRARAYNLPAMEKLDLVSPEEFFATESLIDYYLALMDSTQIGTFLFEWESVLFDRLTRVAVPTSPSGRVLYGAMARAYYYLAISLVFGVPYEPYTLYVPFVEQLLPGRGPYHSFAERALARLSSIARDEAQQLNEYLPMTYFAVETPAVFAYVARKASSSKDLIPIALSVRDSKEATAFRNICTEFDAATRDKDDETIICLIRELENHLIKLGQRLDEPSIGLEIGIPLSVSFEPMHLWGRMRSRRRRHLVFLNRLYEALLRSRSSLDRLGSLVV